MRLRCKALFENYFQPIEELSKAGHFRCENSLKKAIRIQKAVVLSPQSGQALRSYMRQLNLGMVGGGTVGGGVYQAVQRNGPLMASRLGVSFRVVKMAVRDVNKKRAVKIPKGLLTTSWREVVEDPEVNLVV